MVTTIEVAMLNSRRCKKWVKLRNIRIWKQCYFNGTIFVHAVVAWVSRKIFTINLKWLRLIFIMNNREITCNHSQNCIFLIEKTSPKGVCTNLCNFKTTWLIFKIPHVPESVFKWLNSTHKYIGLWSNEICHFSYYHPRIDAWP